MLRVAYLGKHRRQVLACFDAQWPDFDLTDFLNQRDREYCIGMISSRWWADGANVCGAGGRYPSAECGLIVL